MINTDLRDYLESINPEIIVFDNPAFDGSIIGLDSSSERVIYSYDKMVEELSKESNLSYTDSAEFIEFNTIGSLGYAGEFAPIICCEILDF